MPLNEDATAPRVTERYGLSPMQLGMLYHHLSEPGSGIDLEQIEMRLEEALDPAAFERAWRRLAERHPALRTSFRWEGADEPVQEIHHSAPMEVVVEDWRQWEPAAREAGVARLLVEDRRRGFSLDQPPLSRVALRRLGAESWAVVWSFHHILFDGRSFPLLLRELFALYEAERAGDGGQGVPRFELGEPPPSFRGHVEALAARDFTEARAFWRQRLAGFGAPTRLPGERSSAPPDAEGAPEQTHASHATRLTAETTARLAALASERGLSLNTLVQGAWAVLLARHAGSRDVVFGATRACRHGTVEGAAEIVGVFINTLPVRARVAPRAPAGEWLRTLRARELAVREHEQAPLVEVQSWSEVPAGTPLFESLLVFDNYLLDGLLRARGGAWLRRRFTLHERTNYPLTLYGNAEERLQLRLAWDRRRLEGATVERALGALAVILGGLAENPEAALGALPVLTPGERQQLLAEWNETAVDDPLDGTLHGRITSRAALAPDAVALVAPSLAGEEIELTYHQLEARSNQWARHLRRLGVSAGSLVGIRLERSAELVIAALATLKAGAAYVPLDPAYPAERTRWILSDLAGSVDALITQERLVAELPAGGPPVVLADRDGEAIAAESKAALAGGAGPRDSGPRDSGPGDLAYVIYTSGSTGKPKGVMVEHRHVASFFAGMDRCIPHDPPGTWLAVTSLAFDISVLELWWTLARGFKVVLYAEERVAEGALAGPAAGTAAGTTPESAAVTGVAMSLFYFASDEATSAGAGESGTAGGGGKYRLLLEGAKFADRNGFSAVWTPERHFHSFGGLYPNPAVTGAAVAAVTERVGIRAGSVVLPLHNPIRVAEEWAVVDNLSGGRVGLSIASGWHPNDFVLNPESYADAKGTMIRGIETVRRLWRGEKVTVTGVDGKPVEVGTLPRPIQPELPVWVTTAGNPETYRQAGRLGTRVLTHLLGQTVEELGEKIAAYRQAWREAGHGEPAGYVSLMLHTFVGDDLGAVRETVRAPMTAYLRSSLGLIKGFAKQWTALKAGAGDGAVDLEALSDEDMDDLLAFSFERYFETSSLFGTPERCTEIVRSLAAVGVDEIACLIDFGVDTDLVLDHLRPLAEVRRVAAGIPRAEASAEAAPRVTPGSGPKERSIAALVRRHAVTHLQCTPSMARVMRLDDDTRQALEGIEHWLLGGEALPPELAAELAPPAPRGLLNLYGPTETTVWSTRERLSAPVPPSIPIGRPIANTRAYVLDPEGRPQPISAEGQLALGGEAVTRGYFGRPALTAECFVPDPFGTSPGGRLYLTGDLTRWRTDGRLEFLGRGDHQVKLRGYRVELGEIEVVLAATAGVHQAVVVAREDEPGDQRLVAYWVAREGAEVTEATLRGRLREALPEYMVPSHFVRLETLPLTPNAKIDRRALPPPSAAAGAAPRAAATAASPASASSAPLAARSAAPTGEEPATEALRAAEAAIIDVWKEVLHISEVAPQDRFFDLGGHSFLAMKALRRLKAVFERPLEVTDLFRYPTVRALAGLLAGGQAEAAAPAPTTAVQQRAARRRRALGRRPTSDKPGAG